jgi:hypothetical protein
MLPDAFDDTAIYDLRGTDRQGFNIVLFRKDAPVTSDGVDPLYVFTCGDRFSLDAAWRWFSVRRALWQEWGRMAEHEGPAAIIAHIKALQSDDPIGVLQGSVFQADKEPKVLNIGDVVLTATGMRMDILYRHRFTTPGKRKRFLNWFKQNAANGSPEHLVDLAVTNGTADLAEALESIAEGRPVDPATLRVAA